MSQSLRDEQLGATFPFAPPPGRAFVRTCPACAGVGTITVRNNYFGCDEQRPCTTCSQTGQLKCSSLAEGARRVSEWEWAG
jgi:DnaJ-class molecular chaperone